MSNQQKSKEKFLEPKERERQAGRQTDKGSDSGTGVFEDYKKMIIPLISQQEITFNLANLLYLVTQTSRYESRRTDRLHDFPCVLSQETWRLFFLKQSKGK